MDAVASRSNTMVRRVGKFKGRKVSMRDAIFLTLDEPSFSLLAKGYASFMIILIMLATVCLVLETEASPAAIAPGFLTHDKAIHGIFQQIELIMVAMFTVDYTTLCADD